MVALYYVSHEFSLPTSMKFFLEHEFEIKLFHVVFVLMVKRRSADYNLLKDTFKYISCLNINSVGFFKHKLTFQICISIRISGFSITTLNSTDNYVIALTSKTIHNFQVIIIINVISS